MKSAKTYTSFDTKSALWFVGIASQFSVFGRKSFTSFSLLLLDDMKNAFLLALSIPLCVGNMWNNMDDDGERIQCVVGLPRNEIGFSFNF
jgi:hypothetical protein